MFGDVAQIDPPADEIVGDWLTLADVADRLGLPVSRVRQLLRDRKLLAVQRPNGAFCVPAAFLDGDQIVRGLHGTLTLLLDCGFDDADALRWLFTADETLPGTPIQAIAENRRTEVNRRAQALPFCTGGLSRRARPAGDACCAARGGPPSGQSRRAVAATASSASASRDCAVIGALSRTDSASMTFLSIISSHSSRAPVSVMTARTCAAASALSRGSPRCRPIIPVCAALARSRATAMSTVRLPSRTSALTGLPVSAGSPNTPRMSSRSWNAIPSGMP